MSRPEHIEVKPTPSDTEPSLPWLAGCTCCDGVEGMHRPSVLIVRLNYGASVVSFAVCKSCAHALAADLLMGVTQ